MHFSLNAFAIVALVPFLTVMAAPVSIAEPLDIQKRGASDLNPSKPQYIEYPPNPGKRSASATSEVEKRGTGGSPPEPKFGDYDFHRYGPPDPEAQKVKRQRPTPLTYTYAPKHCKNGICDVTYGSGPGHNIEKSKRVDGPTPISYTPYAPPHCSGGLCDVRYSKIVSKPEIEAAKAR